MNYDKTDYSRTDKGENGSGFGQNRDPKKGGRNLRWVFFAVDALLIIAIAAAVLSLVSLFTPFSLFGGNKKETRTVVWTVEIENVSDEFVAALTEGAAATDFASGDVLGTVSAVETRPYTAYADAATADGHVAVVTYDGKTVSVTLTATAAFESGTGYTVEGRRIAAGAKYQLSFAGYVGEALCVNVKEGGRA